jgi:hypothetical protein
MRKTSSEDGYCHIVDITVEALLNSGLSAQHSYLHSPMAWSRDCNFARLMRDQETDATCRSLKSVSNGWKGGSVLLRLDFELSVLFSQPSDLFCAIRPHLDSNRVKKALLGEAIVPQVKMCLVDDSQKGRGVSHSSEMSETKVIFPCRESNPGLDGESVIS